MEQRLVDSIDKRIKTPSFFFTAIHIGIINSLYYNAIIDFWHRND